jgi:phytoene desaturase
MMKKKIAIIGAGPGGLSAGMILAHRGFDVTIFEKNKAVGGRNGELRLGEYSFDIGPTFLHQRFTLDEIFATVGKNSETELEFQKLDPMYRLSFPDKHINPSDNIEEYVKEIAEKFPGNEHGVEKFMKDHVRKFRAIYPCLQSPYLHWWDMMNMTLLKALPYVLSPKSVYQELGKYFDDDTLKLAFTFQAKYLGMSPWSCPALFTILPYIEYRYGMYHVKGGLNKISDAMARIFTEKGGTLKLNTTVQRLHEVDGRITSVELENGEMFDCDDCIVNADFAYSMSHLLDPETKNGRKYRPEKMKKKEFSCSTFMLYLGVDKLYPDEPHHNIMAAEDYHKNVDEITSEKKISDDMSVYVRNASITDETLAPKGHSALYVLVPIINNRYDTDWDSIKDEYRDQVIQRIQERTGMKDLSDHIVEERIITPDDWESDMNIFMGAVFNLSHVIKQMLYFRPHNKMQGFKNVYLTGGGTHPGSGLPTIYESGRIAANLICEQYKVPFTPPDSSRYFS